MDVFLKLFVLLGSYKVNTNKMSEGDKKIEEKNYDLKLKLTFALLENETFLLQKRWHPDQKMRLMFDFGLLVNISKYFNNAILKKS